MHQEQTGEPCKEHLLFVSAHFLTQELFKYKN